MASPDRSFAADWLALRADADRRARDAGLVARLAAHVADRTPGRELRVLDLGAGTGAMLRAMAPRLGPGQRWRLVDADAGLLARVTLPEPAPEGLIVERVTIDLAGDMAALFRPAPDLVTCSALLDLCGAAWLDRLAGLAAGAGAAVHAVLGYDGRQAWAPPHALDVPVLAAFEADQRSDKGLGPALGPGAVAHFAGALSAAGFEVLTARADWQLTAPADAPLIAALAEGTARAAAPALGVRADDWRAARSAARAVTIGHTDLLALPPRRAERLAGAVSG